MLDRLTGLEVFAKVAAAGSFSAAGRALGLSQTMVTKHIAALEQRLGASSFTAARAGFRSPTPAAIISKPPSASSPT